MLILTRKLGENIRIGDKIKIIILDVTGGQVKLGIDAPPNVEVNREEIYVRKREEKRRAAKISKHSLAEVANIFNRNRTTEVPSQSNGEVPSKSRLRSR